MTPRKTMNTASIALPIALALTLVAPVAAAGAHGNYAEWYDKWRDYAKKWQDLKTLLGEGKVDEAEAHFNKHFGAAAPRHAVAEAAVTAAFAALQDLDPAAPAYGAESQVVDKAVYAIAYANLEHAVAEGDLGNAQDWFGVLSAKFTKDTQLPHAKAAFETADNETLAEALAVLDVEYRDLILSKVFVETEETPGLLVGGDVATAAKEAGEALGYYLSIQPHMAATLGADVDEDLRADLSHMMQEVVDDGETLDHRVKEVEDLRDAIFESLASYALKLADNKRGQAYTDYAALLKNDKDLAAARAVYDAHFAHAAEESAADAHARVLAAFEAAGAALAAGSDADFQVERQKLEKSIYEIAFNHAFHKLSEGDTDEAMEYARVLAVKFSWDDSPRDATVALGTIAGANKVDDNLATRAKLDLYDTFYGKVREEVEEVFMNWENTPKAREKAMEGVVYYAPLKAHVAELLGEAVAEELEHELVALYDATTSADRVRAEEVAGEIHKLLDQVAAGGAEITELGSLVIDIKGKLDFVHEEYRDYFIFKEMGDDTEADIEYGEAQAFLAGALKRFTDNREAFEAVDAEKTAKVEANFAEMEAVLDAVGPLEDLAALVEETNGLLAEMKEAGAPKVEGTVTVSLGSLLEADDGKATLPVTLSGLPGDGVAFQVKVKYDNAALEAENVDVLLGDVKAADVKHDDGYVAFNGATTSATAAEEKVAEITFRLLGSAAGTDLEVEVQDLADGAGKALGVKAIEGTSLDLAALAAHQADVTAGDQTSTSTPSPGVLAALAGLGAVAVALRRRRG